MNITQQTKAKVWRDEKGLEIPANRISNIEKLKEKYAYTLAKEALKLNKAMAEFKELIRGMSNEVFNAVLTEKERKQAGKGNFSFHNFDDHIKIETSVNENIEFDSLLIEKAKQKLLDLVGESITSDKAMIKELVLSAFQTSRGKLDTKKILGLKKHASRIKDRRYHEAMQFIDESIRRPDSKTYFRVSVRNEDGAYKPIVLDFAAI